MRSFFLEFTADFSPCTEEWQFASVQFSKSKYRTVQYVRVYCDYGYNSGTVYFDDVQLVRNSLETYLSASDFVVESTGTSDDAVAEVADTTPTFNEATDKFGNALTKTTFTDGEFGTIYRSFKFNADDDCMAGDDAGNNLVEETDARGNKTTYTVDGDTSRNEEVIDRLGNKAAYEYDDSGRTTKVTSAKPQYDENGKKKTDENGNIIYDDIAHVSYAYDTFDNMTLIHRGDGMKYALAYNEFHNLESIGIEGKDEALIKYTYKNGNGRLKQMTYANGHTMKATYNSIGQMVAEKWFETEAQAADSTATPIAHYKYVYDGDGNIVRSIDIKAQKEYNYEYEEGKIVRATEADITLSGEIVTAKTVINTVKYYYDTEGKMTRKVITPASGSAQIIYYETNDDNTVVKFSAGGRTVTSHSKTDSFGRKIFDELQLGTDFVSRQFVYHAGKVTAEHKEKAKVKSSATTQLVSQIILSNGTTLSYGYDAEERITSVVETYTVDGTPVTNTTIYTYDALGQLLTETVNGEVVNSMEYDNYGNITKKNGKAYTYDSTWKDLLTSYNGQAIEYDAQGNPITYLGHTLIWEKGRQLKKFVKSDGTVIDYTYNANGIRTSKTIDGVKHTYTLDGTKILRETWDGNTLIPLYDNEDSVCGFLYNSVPYYFIKNLQDDVIAIVNKDAQTVARYSYDAWGAVTSAVTNTELTKGVDIATINPFRYRGYYYDEEIEFYYLNSRYFYPHTGQFISSDEPVLVYDAYTVLSYDLFTYCENGPVNGCDSNGQKLKNFFNSIVKAVATGTRKVARAVIANPVAVKITQEGKCQSLFNLADFYRDGSGIYHTYTNCWQKRFGYNDLYDLIFYLGTDMKPHKLKFSYDGKDWIFWAWKGDYLNLGAGAELGIYNHPSIFGLKTHHWLAATSHAMKMELRLTYKGYTIIDYKPNEKQWWITGFYPYRQNVKANQLKATFKLKFNDPDMFNSFYFYNKRNDSGTTYDHSAKSATIKF